MYRCDTRHESPHGHASMLCASGRCTIGTLKSSPSLTPAHLLTPAYTFTHGSYCVCVLQLNLSDNILCGVNCRDGTGTYTAEGITAIAEALKVTASLTQLNVSFNSMGEEGEAALRKAIEGRSGLELLL